MPSDPESHYDRNMYYDHNSIATCCAPAIKYVAVVRRAARFLDDDGRRTRRGRGRHTVRAALGFRPDCRWRSAETEAGRGAALTAPRSARQKAGREAPGPAMAESFTWS